MSGRGGYKSCSAMVSFIFRSVNIFTLLNNDEKPLMYITCVCACACGCVHACVGVSMCSYMYNVQNSLLKFL